MENERVEARNVSMYPALWTAVDEEAVRRGFVTGRGPNTSLMLRQIVREFLASRAGVAICEEDAHDEA